MINNNAEAVAIQKSLQGESSADLQALVDDVWKSLQPHTGEQSVDEPTCALTLYLRDPYTDALRLVACRGIRDSSRMFGPILPDFPLHATISRRPDCNPDTYSVKSQRARDFVDREGIKAHTKLVLPLEPSLTPDLILFLNWRDENRIPLYIKDYLRLISQMLYHVAQREDEYSIQEYRNELAAIVRVIRAISTLRSHTDRQSLDEELLRLALDLCHVTEKATASLHIYHPAQETLELISRVATDDMQFNPEEDQQKSRPLTQGITGVAARERKPLLVREPYSNPYFEEYLGSSDILCELAIPLIGPANSLVGVLNLESLSVDAFTPTHITTLSHFAQLAAVLIQNRQHRDAVRRCSEPVISILRTTDLLAEWPAIARELVAPVARDLMNAHFAEAWFGSGNHWTGGGSEGVSDTWRPRVGGITNWMLERKSPVIVRNIASLSQFDLEEVHRSGTGELSRSEVEESDYSEISLSRSAVEVGKVTGMIGTYAESEGGKFVVQWVKFRSMDNVDDFAVGAFLAYSDQITAAFQISLECGQLHEKRRTQALRFYQGEIGLPWFTEDRLSTDADEQMCVFACRFEPPASLRSNGSGVSEGVRKAQSAIRTAVHSAGGLFLGFQDGHTIAVLRDVPLPNVNLNSALTRIQAATRSLLTGDLSGWSVFATVTYGGGMVSLLHLEDHFDLFLSGLVFDHMRAAIGRTSRSRSAAGNNVWLYDEHARAQLMMQDQSLEFTPAEGLYQIGPPR